MIIISTLFCYGIVVVVIVVVVDDAIVVVIVVVIIVGVVVLPSYKPFQPLIYFFIL